MLASFQRVATETDAQAIVPDQPFQVALGRAAEEAGAGLDELLRQGARIARPVRVGRNEQCPCGSGKKWKRCCGFDEPLH